MVKIYGMKRGIEEIITRVKNVQEKPVFIGVYGNPNAGKTYLVEHSLLKQMSNASTVTCDEQKIAQVMKNYPNMQALFIQGLPIEAISNAIIHNRKIDLSVLIYNPMHENYKTLLTKYRNEDIYDMIIQNKDSTIKNI